MRLVPEDDEDEEEEIDAISKLMNDVVGVQHRDSNE